MSACLAGLRVVELASDHAALAGKIFADLGAEVIVVEPPGGHRSRSYGPFVDDVGGPERSLWWWYYNTSKLGVELDLDESEGRARFFDLARSADVVIEGESPGRLHSLGIGAHDLVAALPSLVWVSVTPYGSSGPGADRPATDLTLLASGGAVWMRGYDDHDLPPVRGGGNQAYHLASMWAVTGALVAIVHRQITGEGQVVDVNANAVVNVTTEHGTYRWLIGGSTPVRQTGRHALPVITEPKVYRAADDRWVHTGVPPLSRREFANLLGWIESVGCADDFDDLALLQIGAEQGVEMSDVGEDPLATEVYRAGADALVVLSTRLTAEEFFVGAQRRGLPVGAIYSPDEAMSLPHYAERGFPVQVAHEELRRSVVYPGAPFRMQGTQWAIRRRAPLVGEHNYLLAESMPNG